MLTDQQLIEIVQRADPVQAVERLPDARRTAQQLVAVAEEGRAMKTMTPHEQRGTITTPKRRLRPTLAFAGALILALVTIGSILYLTGGGDGDVAEAPGPSATAAEPPADAPGQTDTPTSQADATAPDEGGGDAATSLADGTWKAVELEFPAHLVEHTSIGYLAGGVGGLSMSSDGVTWHRALDLPMKLLDPQPAERPDDEGPVYETFSMVHAVAEFRSQVYAFGTITTDAPTADPVAEGYVWSTTDGRTWTEQRLPGGATNLGPLSDAAADEAAIIAYASSTDCANTGTEIVVSTDGITWRTVTPTASGLDGTALSKVVATDGGFVALGSTCGESLSDAYPNGRRTMYRSDDGVSWGTVPGEPFTGDEFPEYTAAVDGNTIYVGGAVFDGEQRAALWRSTDGGEHFETIALPEVVHESWSFIHGIAPTSRGFLVVAWLGPSDEPMRTVLLAGEEATSLEVVDDPGGLFVDSHPAVGAVAGNGSVVIVGESTNGFQAWIWNAG